MSSTGAQISLERRWLLVCLRALGKGQRLPAPPATLDWTRVLELAEVESLRPALAHAVERLDGVPAEVRRRLALDLAAGAGRHLVMTRALAALLQHCAGEGLDVIVLKGPVLAERVYPQPALRPFSDLDLLVRADDRFRADAVLRAHGLRRVADDHSWEFDLTWDGATLYEAPSGVRVDLHWALLTEPRFAWSPDESGVWERSVPIMVMETMGRGLGREDHLLYLAAHLAVHHALSGLLHVWDVALLLERELHALDWEIVVARAASWRVSHALYFVLRAARRTFAAPVPASALSALRPGGARAALLAALVAREDREHLARLERLVALLLVDRGRDLYHPLRRALLPPASWMRARYDPTASWPALYRAHWRRLRGMVGGAALALVRGGRPQHS
jgi:putative nucleotidyltransferase-like protein